VPVQVQLQLPPAASNTPKQSADAAKEVKN
jgi:hypothetical protein